MQINNYNSSPSFGVKISKNIPEYFNIKNNIPKGYPISKLNDGIQQKKQNNSQRCLIITLNYP